MISKAGDPSELCDVRRERGEGDVRGRDVLPPPLLLRPRRPGQGAGEAEPSPALHQTSLLTLYRSASDLHREVRGVRPTKHQYRTDSFIAANFLARKLRPWAGTAMRGAAAGCCYQPTPPPPVCPPHPLGRWSASRNLAAVVVVSSRSSLVFYWAFLRDSPWASLPTGKIIS